MKISLKTIKENLKITNLISSDYLYLDCCDDNALYVSNDVSAVKIPLTIEDIKESEKKIYVINKNDFTHLVTFANDDFILDENYHYSSKEYKGMFKHNDEIVDVLSSIKMLFDNSDTYEEFAVVTPSILEKFDKGGIFVNPNTTKPSEKHLNIKDKKIFSSSEYRVYIGDMPEIDKNALLSYDVLKYIHIMGVGTEIKLNNESVLLTDSEKTVSIYLSTMNGVNFLPCLEEKFQSKLESVFKTNKITINLEELKNKLNYIIFYSQNNPNSLGYFVIDGDKSYISANEENSTEIKLVNVDFTEEDGEFKIPFNVNSMLNILSKLGRDVENVTLFVSKDSAMKLFILKFGDSDEICVLAKINV